MPANILSGFRACGIYPFNNKAIPFKAYIPNSLCAAGDTKDNKSMVLKVTQLCSCDLHSRSKRQTINARRTCQAYLVPLLFNDGDC